MDISFLTDYLVVVVFGICICVGAIIKNLIPNDKINRFIPLILCFLGIVLNMWMNSWELTPVILLGGLFSGWAATGAYEAFKNLINKGER